MQEALDSVKTFTPAMLGLGSNTAVGKPTGTAASTSSPVWPPAALSPQSQGYDWVWCIGAWDEKMRVEHGKVWGRIFAGQMQDLGEALAAGGAIAVADFMASEAQRKIQDALALRV